MENFRLLEIHRKKISIKFTILILISVWIIQIIFLTSLFLSNNIKLEKTLESKYVWVENILTNKDKYTQLINEDDISTKIILEKSLNWVTIYENDIRILWNINKDFITDSKYFNSQNNKYFQNKSVLNWNDYHVIIQWVNQSNYYNLWKELLLFILFTLPFSLLLYYIWYSFVWKNFKPIRDTITSLETFTWNINHEMKTPLTEIISTLSLSQKIKSNYEYTIDQSLESAHRLNKILDSMLWIINLVDADYQKEKINIIETIDQIVNDNKKSFLKKNISIKKSFKDKNIYKILNKQQLEICIWNLLKNAIKYSHNNSKIKIEYNNNELIIQDYWIWIEKKNIKKIFNSYFRESYSANEWYWLWLALVKKISDINNWQINIISEKNKGSIIKIKFD